MRQTSNLIDLQFPSMAIFLYSFDPILLVAIFLLTDEDSDLSRLLIRMKYYHMSH